MRVTRMPLGLAETNCYILVNKETKEAIQKLMKALCDNVLPNAYGLFDSIKTGKEKLNPLLLEACKKTHKQTTS